MQDKEIYYGECEKFLYEDTDGYGICGKTNEECYCGDRCHIIKGGHDTLRLRPLLQ